MLFGMRVTTLFFPGTERPERPEVRSLASYVRAGAPRFSISANPEQPDPAFAKSVAVIDGPGPRDQLVCGLNLHVQSGAIAEAGCEY